MTRTRTALTLTTLGLAGLLALPACGAAPGAVTGTAATGAAEASAADVAAEALVLQAVGLEAELGAPAAPDASAAPDPSAAAHRRPGIRKFLRKNTLHGEATVQGKDGVRTVVVQRGTVTAVDAKTVSVKSTDGFTLTWALSDTLRVVQNRAKADRSAVKAGVEIGVAGGRTGDTTTARLIIVR